MTYELDDPYVFDSDDRAGIFSYRRGFHKMADFLPHKMLSTTVSFSLAERISGSLWEVDHSLSKGT